VGWRWAQPAQAALVDGGLPPWMAKFWIVTLRYVAPLGIGYILFSALR
jgi:hypothetical protein